MLVEGYNRAVVAFNERDLEAWIALMDEDVRIESRFSRFGDNYFHGHRAMRRWWADLEEAWEYIRVEPSEVRQVGADETLALLHLAAKGRESGVAIREPTAHRVVWRDGRWVSLSYVDRAAAEQELSTFA
jgi:ketosteroid isomerase-like protein